MKRILLFVFLLTGFAKTIFAQSKDSTYKKQWAEIDSLVLEKGLPKSALKNTNALYTQAKAEKQQDEAIKALLYRLALEPQVTETDVNKQIASISEEIAAAGDEAEAAVLNTILAAVYEDFFNNNSYRFYNRAATKKFAKADVNTWSADDFNDTISSLYNKAMTAAAILQQQPANRFEALVIKGNAGNLRPTLYDLLAHKALDFYKNSNRFVTKPSFAYEITAPAALAPADEFIIHRFSSVDSASNLLQALLLFQQLTKFHSKDVDPSAYIDIDIERLEWVKENSTINETDSLYKIALEAITATFPDNAATSQAWYLLIKIVADKAAEYNPFGDTTHRYGYVKAKQQIEERLTKQPAKSEGNSNMQQLLNEIVKKELKTQVENVNVPGQPFRMYVQYRNVQTMHLRIINAAALAGMPGTDQYEEGYWKAVTQLPYLTSSIQQLPDTKDYQQHATEIKIDPLEPGSYAILASSSANFNDSTDKLMLQRFDVSGISYIASNADYFILNRETGQPLKNVKVKYEFLQWDYKEREFVVSNSGSLLPDANGFVTLKDRIKGNDRNYALTIYQGKDSLKTNQDNRYVPYNNEKDDKTTPPDFEKRHTQFYFFTDRSIYRPGQTVYFKAIAVTKNQQTGKPMLASIKEALNLVLKNTNGQKIDTITIKLNSYGSLSGSFKLPLQTLTGNFSIIAEKYNGTANFNVEDYKRPTFFVEFDTLKSTYRLNDSIKITGAVKAYAGNNLDGAKIKFNVHRDTRFIYPWLFWRKIRPATSSQQIAQGEIITDAEGKFEILFVAQPDRSVDSSGDPVFDFSIDAAVTDINGETRDGSTQLSVGYKSLQLQLSVPGIADLNKFDTIGVTTENFSGNKVAANVKLNIYPLTVPTEIVRNRYWERPDQFVMPKDDYKRLFPYDEYADESDYHSWEKKASVFSGSVKTADSSFIKIAKGILKQGWYAIEAVSKDKDGNEVKDVAYTALYDEQSASLPSPQIEWNAAIKTEGQPGEKAKLLLGTSDKDVYVIQQLQKNRDDKREDQYAYFKLSNQKQTIETEITEQSRKGLGLYYAFVKHNRVYSGGINVYVPYTDKDLDVVYKTYRNKTEPGSKEQWTVEVKGNKGEKTTAELLTAMYDASLDQFKPHEWILPDLWPVGYTNNSFLADDNFAAVNSEENNIQVNAPYFEKIYNELVVNGEAFWVKLNSVSYPVGMLSEQNKVVMYNAPLALEQAPRRLMVTKFTAPKIVADEELAEPLQSTGDIRGAVKKKEVPSFQPRKNFNETAFFIPDLYADTSGNYSFSFTIPEALTQWKWMVLAHTKNLAFGYKQKKIITQKSLMVQPNLPRFVREGDQMEVPIRVTNLADTILTGKATLQLFDAITNDPVDGAFQSVFPDQYFTVEPGKSSEIKFPVSIPFGFNKPVTIRIIAEAGGYSDGEENTLPLLTNRALVTESLPLFLRGDGSKQFKFEKLAGNNSATLTNESITVEYTPNPIWFAIQALPYVAEAKNNSAEQVFNRFYANTMAAYLLKQHPRIKAVFDKWRADTSALKSNLEKNPELKQALLEETPWIIDATNETQQMKNLAILFDLSNMSDATQASLQQLKQMQLPDGSFSWFRGGYPDRYITQTILTGIGRLKMLNAILPDQTAELNGIALRALNYSDNEITREYDLIVKSKVDKNKNNLSASGIQYLFMRSYFKDVPLKDKNAHSFYFFQAMKYWNTQSVYLKGMIAATLFRNYFRTYTYKNIIPSILENTIEDPAKGMYFKNSQWGYYWYQNPVEQQSLMIELLNEMQPFFKDAQMKSAVNDMRTWLLLNKQTNNWKTTKATADACYALLLNSEHEITDNRTVQVKLGNKLLPQDAAAEGTGYIKTRIDGTAVNNTLGNIAITVKSNDTANHANSPSWGAVYWQYFEDLDKITPAATPLSLNKKLFIETNTASGKVLVPVNDNDELKVGDKVVIRLELRSDRNMEYLHLKDMRASAMEPSNVLSGFKWQDGLGYYEATKDASSDFFIDHLSRGTYVFEYPCYITQRGNFSVGIATIQCMYAPDFSSHSEGIRINVE